MTPFKFRIGQQVACIGIPEHLRALNSGLGITLPVDGGVYTIRGRGYFPGDVLPGQHYNGNGYLLEEVVNPPICNSLTFGGLMEGHINEEFFRPLIADSLQMEALRKLQDPVNHQNWGDGDFPGVPTRKEKAA